MPGIRHKTCDNCQKQYQKVCYEKHRLVQLANVKTCKTPVRHEARQGGAAIVSIMAIMVPKGSVIPLTMHSPAWTSIPPVPPGYSLTFPVVHSSWCFSCLMFMLTSDQSCFAESGSPAGRCSRRSSCPFRQSLSCRRTGRSSRLGRSDRCRQPAAAWHRAHRPGISRSARDYLGRRYSYSSRPRVHPAGRC